jgi:nicotinate dehydrogenase subunit A
MRYVLRVNGTDRDVDAEPADSLLSILRNDLVLTGSKYGCGEGQCGACTVLLDGAAARSCVTRVASIGAKAITTIEGLAPPAAGGREPALHPIQQAFLDAEAFQCGYCTSGMIMATAGLLKTNPRPTEQDIARLMDRTSAAAANIGGS